MQMLSADIFSKSAFHYKKQFEFILKQLTACYYSMLNDYQTIENNENTIRNRLNKDYLNNNQVIEKLGLIEFFFDIESPEINDLYEEEGRTDIKIYNVNERMHDKSAYYIMECKRLDGNKALNREYIRKGIQRFVDKKYPSYYQLNGMLGFIVKKIDIHKNIRKINLLIKQEYPETNTTSNLKNSNFIKDFNYSYISMHSDSTEVDIELYHIMWDFHKLIAG
ncbi:MAG: hypothetical protein JXB48_19760 [Candidatus Latescibacteria bacterium]|nr:hypothetical protein [Candidatus Latescibacterota bacterium]